MAAAGTTAKMEECYLYVVPRVPIKPKAWVLKHSEKLT